MMRSKRSVNSASRQDVCGSNKQNSDKHPRAVSLMSNLKKQIYEKFYISAKCTPSDKEQLPKPMRQSVRDNLHRGIMILPSIHMLEAMGAAT